MALLSGEVVASVVAEDWDFRGTREVSVARVLVSDVSSEELKVDARLCLEGGLRISDSGREGSERVRLFPDLEKVCDEPAQKRPSSCEAACFNDGTAAGLCDSLKPVSRLCSDSRVTKPVRETKSATRSSACCA